MKYSKRIKKLAEKISWYDKQDKAYQAACKRPGSLKK